MFNELTEEQKVFFVFQNKEEKTLHFSFCFLSFFNISFQLFYFLYDGREELLIFVFVRHGLSLFSLFPFAPLSLVLWLYLTLSAIVGLNH